ncbi:striatin-3 isoform X1 [Diabrotica virgifera virgifera]|uniref:Striatin-3 isoform X1 n=1 Tax=Diabrotica virgifera virgifera TaxID=50390 RepID=A0A6P7GVE6_DIAVI|nr:striatin-3 isoform X1 [Diabrotica virgifera virgifera]
MEDTSLNLQNGGQMGPQGGSVVNNKQNEDVNPKAHYSIPGILHFIQHEWARFELERSQWEVDRAELQARIAFLQGERKGQENLKNDLVRRIKMLEYALKQERAKFHKLKYGTELQQGDMKPPVIDESSESQIDSDQSYVSVSNSTWKQGRQLLRQYLQEIGYTDRIIDVRSTRVRSLLGLNNNNADQEDNQNGSGINTNESNKRASETQGRRTPAKKAQPSSLAEAMILDTEAAVMANLDFLSNTDVDMDDDDDMSDDVDIEPSDDIEDDVKLGKKDKMDNDLGLGDDVDAIALEVFNELNRLSEAEKKQDSKTEQADWNKAKRPIGMNDEDNVDSTLGLGELAQLTVNNDAESTYDIASSKEAFRKTWNAKYTLRSHFDGVRALAFHPTEPLLITASEDHTLKLWNLQKTVPAKKSASLDVEPLYTFRSHTGPVLCLAISGTGEHCYSGGLDGTINCWNVPNSNIDPYDLYEPDVLNSTLHGHSDAVWGLAVLNSKQQLLSCSADKTVKLWAPHSKQQLLSTFISDIDGIPSSVAFVRDEPNRIVASYSSLNCVIFDTETGKPVTRLESTAPDGVNSRARQINKVVCHPTLPLTITAHEDTHIRFWDNHTGKMVHSMVAHLDAVTSLAVDPNGLYILSGSHDCSIRLWHLDNKTCVQEITAHRKKFDESILDVAFHPSRPYIASAGADGLAKVFV